MNQVARAVSAMVPAVATLRGTPRRSKGSKLALTTSPGSIW